MYKISVPVKNRPASREMDREAVLAALRRVGAQRTFLCVCRSVADADERAAEIESLRRNRPFFEAAGLEVGVWMSALGHGGPLVSAGDEGRAHADFTRLTGLDGATCADSFCPMDEAYRDAFAGWIGEIARAGAKLVMLDDDYRLAYRPNGLACCCERHLKRIGEILGHGIDRPQVKTGVLNGGMNDIRRAWMQANGESLLALAQRCREAVDRVDPRIQLGFCSCLSSWSGIDGTDALALTRAFAGSAAPFLRTIGAPYWHVAHNWGASLGDIIELNRMEAHWSQHSGFERFAEGDVYPRPRFACPAAYLEAFDTALEASGELDGILKYVLDYSASPRYETGYVEQSVKNDPARAFIREHFAGKTCAGAVVKAMMRRLDAAALPESGANPGELADEMFLSMEARMLAAASVPMAYAGDGPRVAFGQNASLLTTEDLARGVVTDAPGALLLAAQGFDLGFTQLRPSALRPACEHFPQEDERVALGGLTGFYEAELATDRVEIDSELLVGGRRFPGSWRCGGVFVFAFDAFRARNASGALKGNLRATHLVDALEAVGGRLPATCKGNPNLYLMAKRGPDGLALGLWNLFEDPAGGRVKLDRVYARAVGHGVRAHLEGDALVLDEEIPAWRFALFHLFQDDGHGPAGREAIPGEGPDTPAQKRHA